MPSWENFSLRCLSNFFIISQKVGSSQDVGTWTSDFLEATNAFSKSKAITSGNITSIFELFLIHLIASFSALDTPSQDAMRRPMRIE